MGAQLQKPERQTPGRRLQGPSREAQAGDGPGSWVQDGLQRPTPGRGGPWTPTAGVWGGASMGGLRGGSWQPGGQVGDCAGRRSRQARDRPMEPPDGFTCAVSGGHVWTLRRGPDGGPLKSVPSEEATWKGKATPARGAALETGCRGEPRDPRVLLGVRVWVSQDLAALARRPLHRAPHPGHKAQPPAGGAGREPLPWPLQGHLGTLRAPAVARET